MEVTHTLPLAGGLFDQPHGYMFRIEAVMRADYDLQQVENEKRKAQQSVKERTGGVRR